MGQEGPVSALFIVAGWKLAFAYLIFTAMLFVLSAAELAFPREEVVSWPRRWNFIRFAAVFIAVDVAFAMFIFRLTPWQPLTAVRNFAGFVIALYLADFLYYWYHRAQHRFAWLWRFHSVHHSIEKMGAGAGYHHFLEIPFKALFVGIPLSLVIGSSTGPIIAVIFSLHGPYLHSTTRLNFGRFAWIVADNRTHRAHHALSGEQCNFGALTMIWDAIFGTARFRPDEWPEIGIVDQQEPGDLRSFIAAPFRFGQIRQPS